MPFILQLAHTDSDGDKLYVGWIGEAREIAKSFEVYDVKAAMFNVYKVLLNYH